MEAPAPTQGVLGKRPPASRQDSSEPAQFRCLDQTFTVSQADLDRAPSSVLAEAWRASVDGAAVSLDAWPAPDVEILEVVLGVLRQAPYAKPDSVQAINVVHALEYFGLPEKLWPTGLQLLQRKEQSIQIWADRDRDTASRIVKELCRQVLLIPVDQYVRPAPRTAASEVYGRFSVTAFDDRTRHFTIAKENHQGVDLPSGLKAAILAAEKAEHVRIEYETSQDRYRGNTSVVLVKVFRK